MKPFRFKFFLGPSILNSTSISPIIESISDIYAEINSAERKEPSDISSNSAFGDTSLELEIKSRSTGIFALPFIRFL